MGIMHVIPCSTYTHAVHYAHDMLHDKFTYKINFLISIKIFLSHLSIHTFWNLCIMRMINAHVHDAHDMLQKCAFCPSLILPHRCRDLQVSQIFFLIKFKLEIFLTINCKKNFEELGFLYFKKKLYKFLFIIVYVFLLFCF